ncbi:L-histidine N(alpha)-methyltransferase [Geitlerinema calcuttense]|uniref:L-histidine N(alpha)-methyltransferase n=1 Tax=Geitlerinema calcuttense TaxID=1471433 RepID=UPI003D812CEC
MVRRIDSNFATHQSSQNRLTLEQFLNTQAISHAEGLEVIQGLTQNPKTLPPKYFYDSKGSHLFEQICQLPEYYPTRTETAILKQYASEIAQLTGPCELVELGSGSSTKTRILLDAYQKLEFPLRYIPIDVSAGMLEDTAQKLLTEYPSLQVHALASTYEVALTKLPPTKMPTRMLCFIGSTLGNLDLDECDRFFSQVTDTLTEGEYFLLGVDLQKPKEILEAAYNDAQGITAEFNLNLLNHLNRRFQANFDLSLFEHWAFYNEDARQIEMHLRSLKDQVIHLRELQIEATFAAGETLRTEISRKFELQQMQAYLQAKGLKTLKYWTDSRQWFGLILAQLQLVEKN